MSTEPLNKSDTWNPYFHKQFAGFASMMPLLKSLGYLDSWPSVDKYNAMLNQHDVSPQICFVLQHKAMQYEWEIYQHRKVPTRPNLWHDFFNNLSWIMFPKLKWALIKRAYEEGFNQPGKARTSLQNVLAHFDECGMVICTDSEEIKDKIRTFAWKALFCQTRNLAARCLPVIVGHGLLEKGLSPYIGMTGKAIFLKVDNDFFKLATQAQNKIIDERIAHYIGSSCFPHDPKALQPFPLLGWPGWYPDQSAAFYDNSSYFRERM